MTANHVKALKLLNNYQRVLKPDDDLLLFFRAICEVRLDDYYKAQQSFGIATDAMFKTELWKRTNQPHWLVDICVLSGRTDLYPDVLRELDFYKTNYRNCSDSLPRITRIALILKK